MGGVKVPWPAWVGVRVLRIPYRVLLANTVRHRHLLGHPGVGLSLKY